MRNLFYKNENMFKIAMRRNNLSANIFAGNIKSIKLLEKFGFVLTGTKNYLFRGKDYPHKMYSLYIK